MISAPEDVAWHLASHARDALSAVEEAPTGVMEGISDALGVGFIDAEGRPFCRSTLVQTLFYGVFSAWVLWAQQPRAVEERFQWRDTTDLLNLPILEALFHEMTRPTLLFNNALREQLDRAESLLNRVDRETFYKRFPEHEAVQYFYEPFLQAFDPALRWQLGVWYTPDEVVRYIVERVDRALRDELDLADGLADPGVVVLDPACGTGGFLLAVLDRIARTLNEQGHSAATVRARLLQAVTTRLHGFEISPAPYVIAHLQVTLYLRRLGVTIPEGARAGISLTNALTDWSRAAGHPQKAPVLVVLGNPPYSAFAGVQPRDEQESVDVYKEGLIRQWKVRKFNLDELFVRFFRLAERKVAEQSGRGVVCYISSASYAADPSFVVMRSRFLKKFDRITIDSLNGDSRETGKMTPDGEPDPSIFSTERNREGIRVGTAIGLFVLRAPKSKHRPLAQVRWREFWGATKRPQLIDALAQPDAYTDVAVTPQTKWSFRPRRSLNSYGDWSDPLALCGHEPISGLAEKRRTSLIAMDRATLQERFNRYFDEKSSWTDVKGHLAGLATDSACYPARETRAKLLKAGEAYSEANIRRYAMLPLDNRYCYHTNSPPLWNRSRPKLSVHAIDRNRFLVLRGTARQADEGIPALIVSALPDHHLLDPNVVAIPLTWYEFVGDTGHGHPNLSAFALAYLAALGLPEIAESDASLLWYHYIAVLHAPSYLTDNGEAVRADVPRVPLPRDLTLLRRSAALGRQIADLLDPDQPVKGVTTGALSPELRPLGALVKVGESQIDPASGDLALTNRWGGLQRGTIVMPGPGRRTANPTLADHPLGPGAWDIWMNDRVYWSAVPDGVWAFTIGGYQVIKKWLSYRDRSVLGRDLTLDEADHVVTMIRRIASVLLLSTELDAIYRAVSANLWRPPATAPTPSQRPRQREARARS
jgi:hypothetical protein